MANHYEDLDAAGSNKTTYAIAVGDTFFGNIEKSQDSDWIGINMIKGQNYRIQVNLDSLLAAELRLYDKFGNLVANSNDALGSTTTSPVIQGTALETDKYYIDVKGAYINGYQTGTYNVTFDQVASDYTLTEMSDAPNSTKTPYKIGLGETFYGNINHSESDREDWVAITLEAGEDYKIYLNRDSILSANLKLYDSFGNLYATSNESLGSHDTTPVMQGTALTSGTYYIAAEYNYVNGYQYGTYGLTYDKVNLPYTLTELKDAPHNTSTPYILSSGESFLGNLNDSEKTNGDWVGVNFVAGEEYRIKLNLDTLAAAELTLYNKFGQKVKTIESDGNKEVLLSGVADETATFYLGVKSQYVNGYSSGSYSLSYNQQVDPDPPVVDPDPPVVDPDPPLVIEPIEAKEPTAAEQYMLELINRARANPEAEASRYGIDLNQDLSDGAISSSPKAPLAMNTKLVAAAADHSQWILEISGVDNDAPASHTGRYDLDDYERIKLAGYDLDEVDSWNVLNAVEDMLLAQQDVLDEYHEILFLNGFVRRKLFLSEDYSETGIGIVTGDYYGTPVSSITWDSSSSDKYFLTGVIYQDDDNDDFYTPGEGLGGVTISLPYLGIETQTWGSGGYQLEIPEEYLDTIQTVEFSGGNLSDAITLFLEMGSENTKIDMKTDANWTSWQDYLAEKPDEPEPGEDDGITSNEVFTIFELHGKNGRALLDQIKGNTRGLEFSDYAFFEGAAGSASFFESIDFGPGVYMNTPGILLSSGSAAPSLKNTSINYSYDHKAPGNDVLDIVAKEAFSGAGSTQDAATLEFAFMVKSPSVKSVSFDLIFGSEEYPEYANTSWVDIAAVVVNGKNYALFDGDPTKPLSVVGNTVAGGNLLDNVFGDPELEEFYGDLGSMLEELGFTDVNFESPYDIEYNGISPRLTISIPVEVDTSYSVLIGIADTDDGIYDSGLFVSNFRSNYSTAVGGTQVEVSEPDDSGVYNPAGKDTATNFIGTTGKNEFIGSTAADTYDITLGSGDTIKGTPKQLDGDLVIGFTSKDQLILLNTAFTKKQIQTTQRSDSLEINIDSDNDGVFDTLIKLDGNYEHGSFSVDKTKEGTAIKFKINVADNEDGTNDLFNGTNFVDSFMGSLDVSLSSFTYKAVTTKIQNNINKAQAQDMTLAAVMGSFPAFRESVPEGEKILPYFTSIVKAIKGELGARILVPVSNMSVNEANEANFSYKFSFIDDQQFASFRHFSKGDQLDFSSWSGKKPLQISFDSEYSTELSYLVAVEDLSSPSTWSGSFLNLGSWLVDTVMSFDGDVDSQLEVLNEFWGNDWLLLG